MLPANTHTHETLSRSGGEEIRFSYYLLDFLITCTYYTLVCSILHTVHIQTVYDESLHIADNSNSNSVCVEVGHMIVDSVDVGSFGIR